MEYKSEKKSFVPYRALTLLAAAILTMAAVGTTMAKSLYVIADIHSPCPVQAYEILAEPDYLVLQTTLNVPYEGIGAVGLTIDAIDVNNAFLFVSYERSNVIRLVDATTMIAVGDVNAPGADNLAGIVVDQDKRKVYTVQRNSNHLYVYDWDANSLTLTLEGGTYKTLDCDQGLYGIAIDEENDLLYVGDSNTTVKYYDTATWTRQGQFTVSHGARGIAVDVPRQYVYTASGGPGGGDLLSKYDLNTDTETVADVNSTALGIAVDPATGLVYVTTYGDGSRPDRVLVYDGPNLTTESVPVWESDDIGNPSGLCVADKDVSYKPPPNGDYGDAPDAVGTGFPTKFATTNSRLGGRGVHHLTTGLEMLGVAVSAEDGAEDPNDPDGLFNLVDNDANDDGVLALARMNWGAPFGIPMSRLFAQVRVTIDAGAPAVTRYLNILFDTNSDMEWRNTAFGPEWLVVNQEIDTAPGQSETFFVSLGIVPTSSLPVIPPHPWLRATLTRTPIDETATVGMGGWDGSGQFEFGETEDYDDLPIIRIPNVSFKLWCEDCPLMINHTDQGSSVIAHCRIAGDPADVAACTINHLGSRVGAIGPLIGVGVYNGAEPGVVGAGPPPAAAAGFGWKTLTKRHPLAPITHVPPEAPSIIQSFDITFRFNVTMGADIVWSGTKTCGVLIFHHPWMHCWKPGLLYFGGANQWPADQWIPVLREADVNAVAYIMFGNEQPTPGTITVFQNEHYPPGIPESERAGVLSTTSIVKVEFDSDPNTYDPCEPNTPEVETEITGLRLTGYTDEMVADSRGITDESMLSPFKMPFYPNCYYDVFAGLTDDVGSEATVDTYNNYITIDNPSGFSIWGMRVPQYLVVDDFEPYGGDSQLGDVWADGWHNGTTSSVYLETDANLVHTGAQSMQFEYDNSLYPYYGEAEANTVDLPVGSDWTWGGAKALTLWLYYVEGSNAEPMYVMVEDSHGHTGTVTFDGDPNDLRQTDWYEWNIDLHDFNDAGVELDGTEKLYIGIGDRGDPQPGGSGTLYFDDLRLYPPRCVPEYGPAADCSGDCAVDYKDLRVLSSEWLTSGVLADFFDDNNVNFHDFSVLADAWLEEQLWP